MLSALSKESRELFVFFDLPPREDSFYLEEL